MIVNRNKITPRQNQLWVDVYSYKVKEAMRKHEALIIEVGGQRMVIPPERLKSYEKLTNQKFISQFGGKDYFLYSYKWKPETEEEELKRCLI